MALSFPAGENFSAVSFSLETNSSVFQSPISRVAQVLSRTGARWVASYSIPPTKDAGTWQAFMLRLRGPAGEFHAYDPARRTSLGIVGTGVVATTGGSEIYPSATQYPGAAVYPQSQARAAVSAVTSTTLAQTVKQGTNCVVVVTPVTWDYTTGAHANYEAGSHLKAGDYIQIGDELKMVVMDVPAGHDHDQVRAICFEPPLRSGATAGTTVTLKDATCIMRLIDDQQATWSAEPAPIYSMKLSGIESL